MALKLSFFWALLAACSASALPLNIGLSIDLSGIDLAIAAKLNASGATTIIAADRARAARLKNAFLPHAKRQNTDIEVANDAVTYLTTVNIGSPATAYTLLVDTGSSNTWVGGDKKYQRTETSKDTGKSVSVTYGGGSFSGREYIDRVDLGNGLVINEQSIGVANESRSFGNGIDGILGVGPTGLTRGSIKDSQETVPTVTDNLASQGTTGAAILGMFFAPYTESDAKGILTFGGANPSLYTGDLNYVGITDKSPASQYWGIDQSITYSDSQIMGGTAGIVDSGTTMILLASDALKAYKDATGAVEDQSGFLKLTREQYGNLKPLDFNIGSKTYTLTPNAQIWPRSLNRALGGSDDGVYLVIGDLGSNSGEGFDFINGYLWMERFYTVFDTPNKRIGIAKTKYTDAEDN